MRVASDLRTPVLKVWQPSRPSRMNAHTPEPFFPRSFRRRVRVRTRGGLRFAFIYEPHSIRLSEHLTVSDLILGQDELPPGGVAAWTV